MQAGTYTVNYRIAAGLQGKAKAVTDDGSDPEGEFVVRISSAPPQTRVNDAGQVVPIKPSGDRAGGHQSGEVRARPAATSSAARRNAPGGGLVGHRGMHASAAERRLQR